MERASYFIQDKAIFGSYPTQEAVYELEKEGVRFFINLTYSYEKKIIPYTTKYTYINFPIKDNNVPQNWKSYSIFLIKVSDIIKKLNPGELIYIHCKGGHGRSGIVVASLMCYIYNMNARDALDYTNKTHNNRSLMRDKWRKIGSPQTEYQKNFVYKFFEPIYFYRTYNRGYTAGFSNFTNHSVTLDKYTFPTAEAAIQACKNIDEKYIIKQTQSRTPIMSKNIGRKIELRPDWINICDESMFNILLAKFTQHDELRINIMNTGLRPIIQHTRGDVFWGDGWDGKGRNKLGNALMRVREYFYRNEYY